VKENVMASTTKATIIPAFRYRDAHAAIDFLCRGFGFERHAVYEGPDGTIAHAQLVLGPSMIMLGSATNDGDYGQWVKPPASRDAATTQGLYVVVDDCDAHCARARAAGAVIVREPENEDYGGRGYTCRDLEGHVWSFGTYDPWAAHGS
jgi:uncharacterized glyoxalase superfamily protein PhnB